MSYGTLTYTENLIGLTCWCGTGMGVAESLYRLHRNKRSPSSLYCPLGHSVIFGQKSAVEAERERRIAAEAALAREQDALEAERRSHSATRGHLTRIRNRVANGVCPWCQRSFTNVRRHVASKHPDHAGELAEATS